MRKIRDLVAYCTLYEFEDVVLKMTGGDLVEVDDNARLELSRRVFKWTRRATRSARIAAHLSPPPSTVKLSRDYELFLPVFSDPYQLHALTAIPDWRKRCRKAACVITEVWSHQLPDYLLRHLAEFDHIFLSLQDAVPAVEKIVGRPVSYLPYAVDVPRFAPIPDPAPRSIDMCNIGRRSAVTHQALMRLADARRIFYYYDTVAAGADMLQRTFRVDSHGEHRGLFASLLRHSRYFIANRSRVNEPEFLARRDEVSARFYEGAAAGVVMVGEAPRNESFRQQFDWPDAVIHLPFDSPDVGDLLAQLDSDPGRLLGIRRENVRNAAIRHDWLHRYEQIIKTIGVQATPAMEARRASLNEIARAALVSAL